MCIYYGDCPFVTTDCEEDTPHYKCRYRLPIRQALEQAHMTGQADARVDNERIIQYIKNQGSKIHPQA